jgi:hypothetical protein
VLANQGWMSRCLTPHHINPLSVMRYILRSLSDDLAMSI